MHNYSSLKISLSIEKFGDYSFDTERKLREAKGLNHKARPFGRGGQVRKHKAEYEAGRPPEMLAALFHPAESLLQEFYLRVPF